MINSLSASYMVSVLMRETTGPETLNEDYAHYLGNTPAPIRGPLLWRLLPKGLRAPLKARIQAWRYEKSLIAIWQNSPHLFDDMGVILSKGAVLPDYLVAAPQRVIRHVAAIDPAQVAKAELKYPPDDLGQIALPSSEHQYVAAKRVLRSYLLALRGQQRHKTLAHVGHPG